MSVATPSRPAQAEFSIRSILAPLVAIVLGTFMAILDTTVVNVALPTLGRAFNADLQALQWVITGYMLAQAAVIPLSGWLSDHFGAKRVYLTALVLFTLGSLLCATAQSAGMLVVFRVLQGLGGGMLMPVGMAFIYRLAPADKRGQVMGAFGVPILLGPALGPVLSGYLLEYATWPMIFLINLPIGIAAVVACQRFLPDLRAQRQAGALDLPGFVLGPLAFASLSYGISQSTTWGWTGTPTVAGITIGMLALVAFVIRELTTREPLLELRVFRGRDFTLAILTQWGAIAALFGTMFLLPLFLQQVRGYGAFETGLYTLPQALVAALFMPIGGRLFDRFGARPTVLAGLTLNGLAMWLLSRVTAATSGTDLLPVLALWGAGMGLMMMPLGTHVMNSAPRNLVSRVTALSGALQSVVASLAIASIATLWQGRLTTYLAQAGAALNPPVELLHAAQAAAFGDAYRAGLLTLALALLLATTLRRRPTASGEAAAHAGSREAGAAEHTAVL